MVVCGHKLVSLAPRNLTVCVSGDFSSSLMPSSVLFPSCGADFEAVDRKGNTPAHLAAALAASCPDVRARPRDAPLGAPLPVFRSC